MNIVHVQVVHIHFYMSMDNWIYSDGQKSYTFFSVCFGGAPWGSVVEYKKSKPERIEELRCTDYWTTMENNVNQEIMDLLSNKRQCFRLLNQGNYGFPGPKSDLDLLNESMTSSIEKGSFGRI